MNGRVYLDWNATTPLRVEARDAMIAAMDVVGNPSSVHAEGRAAKSLVEKARAQVADAFGANAADIVFTSSATEAIALLGNTFTDGISASNIEHDSVSAVRSHTITDVSADGELKLPMSQISRGTAQLHAIAIQAANSETGVLQDWTKCAHDLSEYDVKSLCDAVQAFGKVAFVFDWTDFVAATLSAHKIGGPKGVGALVLKRGLDVSAQIKGGGQEMGRRAGTENLIGIAGFGAAAEAAANDLANGVWDRVANLRDMLETVVSENAPDTVIVGKSARRLPNTSCLVTPGWKGETQVMQMDLAGFAISAGSACSSGKVKPSNVLRAMGFSDADSASAIRVSLGPDNTEDDVMRFAETWLAARNKHRARAA